MSIAYQQKVSSEQPVSGGGSILQSISAGV
jgi:hypothetical protein